MAEKGFDFTIVDEIGVLSTSPKGWRKELNLISWNGRDPKYDIRDWAPDHEKMGKGVTLSDEEIKELRKVLTQMFDSDVSQKSITIEELIEHWNDYISLAPEPIRKNLIGSRLNKMKNDTVVVCVQKGGAYGALSEQTSVMAH